MVNPERNIEWDKYKSLGNRSKRVATFDKKKFQLIKKECKRLFIKLQGESKPCWINEDQVFYTFEEHY